MTHALFSPINDGLNRWLVASRGLVALPLAAQIVAVTAQGFSTHRPEVVRDDAGIDLSRYLTRYQSNNDKLIFHEKIAIQLGDPVGYDWYLLDILTANGRYDPSSLKRQVACAQYEAIVFSTRPYSFVEREVYRQVVAATESYRFVGQDSTVIEFRRIHAAVC